MSDTKQRLNTKGADTADRLERLLKKLIHCMSQETLALQANNRSIAEEMGEEKARLLHNYRAMEEELKKSPDQLSDIDPDIKSHLKDVMSEFETIMKDNIRVILSGRYAINRLISRIMDKAREAAYGNHKYYDAQGKLNHTNNKNGMMPTKLNETF